MTESLVAPIPKPPAALSPAERAFWRKLAPAAASLGRLEPSDAPLFMQLCKTLCTVADCEALLAEEGLTVATAAGARRSHPVLRSLEGHRRQAAKLLAEFGLSPTSRLRIKAELEQMRMLR